MSASWRLKQRFFVFIRTAAGEAYRVGREIAEKKPGLFSELYSVAGEWDLVLRAEFDSDRDFGESIMELLSDIDGVERTHSIIAYPLWDPDDIYFEED